MPYAKILVPVDGSEGSRKALEQAANIAQLNADIKVDVVYVAPIPHLSKEGSIELANVVDAMKEDGKEILEAALEYLGDVADQADVKCIAGENPAYEIVKLAQEGGYDLIVIGNRGLSGRKEYTGSVSYRVLHLSPISVLIAK